MGDGPWAWEKTRYMLLDGALDETTTTYSLSSTCKLRTLGTAIRTQTDPSKVIFELNDAPPLPLELGATFDEAGVGSRVWDSSIALALFQRTRRFVDSLPPAARIAELGSGLGLPSLDLSRWQQGIGSVLMTDSRPKLVMVAEHNLKTVRSSQSSQSAGNRTRAAKMDWTHSDEEDSAGSVMPSGSIDVLIASDVCYEAASVAPLVDLVEKLDAPLMIIIGPNGRPSMQQLRKRLFASDTIVVEERQLTLVCSNANESGEVGNMIDGVESMRSAGVHMLLVLKRRKAATVGV
jgi:predicted nicotinamide N-methyase